MNFIIYMTQGIIFSISRLFYDMDYYSIIISSLVFKVFYAIMHFIDSNKDTVGNLMKKEKKEQLKVFHLVNHIIYLTYLFNTNKKLGKISLYNGGLNSLSKYLLNNFIEVVSKCVGLEVPSLIPKFQEPTQYQIIYKNKFYKCYLQRYKKYEDNSLLRIFMLYYNSKMTFWKSILLVAKEKDNKTTITCRTCEKEIPIEDIFIHFGCCKEQQSYYDKMKLFKLKLEKYITNLDIYLAKSNFTSTPIKRKIFNKGHNFYNLTSKIPGCENDEEGDIFLKNLIELYKYEKNKPSDYYDKNPEKIHYIVSMSYFSLMLFIMNKISNELDQELGEIIGGIFCTFLQIFMNANFLLYIKKSKTKNNMIKFRKNQMNNYEYNSKKDLIGDSFTLPDSSKYNESKSYQKSEKILNDDLLKSDFNIKSRIEKYKMKLSLNNMLLYNNSLTLPRSNSTITETKNNNNFLKRDKRKKKTLCAKLNSRINKKVKNSPNKRLKKIMSFFDNNENNNKNNINFDNYNSEISNKRLNISLDKKIHNSVHHRNSSCIRRFSHNKLNIYNYRKIRRRSIKMTRRKSNEIYLFKNKEQLFLNLLSNNKNINENSIIKENKSENLNNLTNNSYSEESVSYFNNTLNLIDNDNNSNIFQNDISLSRIDSDLLRQNSDISKFDSIGGTRDDSQKYFLSSNSNSNSFQLEYRKDNKNANQKPSLFFNNSSEFKKEENNKKTKSTLFKKNEKNNEEKENSDSSDMDDDLNVSDNKNIILNDFEEEENNEQSKAGESSESPQDSNSNENDNNNYKGKINKKFKNLISNDFNQIFPDILDKREKTHINYDQLAEIFINLIKEMKEDQSKEIKNLDILSKENSSNKKPIIKSNREKTPNPQNKSIKFKNEEDIIININSIKENSKEDINKNKINSEEIKRISKFKLILPIAKGGYGVVGLYKNVKTNDIYAIKTVDIKSMKEKNLSNTLKNEQNILKQIDSQYLVNSYFIFKDKKNYYFVMEYLPGGDVYTLLSKNNLPKKTIQLIVAETILAVNYLHNISIIHHDIKPENILITQKGHFKLSDFGLSKTLEKEGDSDLQVVKNIKNFVEFNKILFDLGDDEDENKDAVGTLNYMAPELFTDKYPQGGGVDYWAIGVLIFDLFSFSLPFEAKTQEELRDNIINVKIDWSKLINDQVKKVYGNNINSAVDLIKKFLRENPNDRWGDKNLEEIKSHKFFEGFNWDEVGNIKNETIKEYVKERAIENNKQIKQRMIREKNKEKNKNNNNDTDEFKTEDGYPITIEINLTESEEKYFFTERFDNLNKKNKELIKKKIEKEVNIEDNISDLMLIDLE